MAAHVVTHRSHLKKKITSERTADVPPTQRRKKNKTNLDTTVCSA